MKNAGRLAAPKTITIKHLLTHTAGLPENAREETRGGEDAAGSRRRVREQADAVRAGLEVAVQPDGDQLARADRRGRRGQAVRRLPRRADLQAAGHDRHDVLPVRRAAEAARDVVPRRRTGSSTPTEIFIFAGRDLADRDRVPLANGGLFSTAPRLRPVRPDAPERRHARRQAVPEARDGEADVRPSTAAS